MQHTTIEHTGLLRMGLEADSSALFWKHARAGETPAERRERALEEGWYPELSEARLRYLLGELEKRFPAPARAALLAWDPTREGKASLVCHWHLQWSDPLYREFTATFLVSAWARSDEGVSIGDVERWLEGRGTHGEWSPSTRRRLASGLLGAATEAGLVRGQGRNPRELQTVAANAHSLAYLSAFLKAQANEAEVDGEVYKSGLVFESGESEALSVRSEGDYEALEAFAASFSA